MTFDEYISPLMLCARVVNVHTRDKMCARAFTTHVHAFMHKSL